MFVLKTLSVLVLVRSCVSADFNCGLCQCSTIRSFVIKADCSYKNTEIQLDEIPGNFSQRIDEMDLRKQSLKVLKEYVFKNANLTDLQELIINDCQISTIHKNAFDNMTKLRRLYLSNNNITFIYEETLYWLKTLETLDLSNNNIKYPPNLGNFINLRDLSLGKNELCYLNEQFLENTTSLESLYLSHNKIETIASNTFGRLTNLKYLHIANNNLTRLPVNVFQNNTKLDILVLANNALVGLPDKLLENLKYLAVLSLKFIKIQTIPKNLFYNKTEIMILDLSNNEIEELPETIFHNMHCLQMLKLSFNNIKSLHPRQFATDSCNHRPNIFHVYLDHNKINVVPSNLFETTCDTISITLSFNNISKIDPNAFSGAEIYLLDLSHNQLTNLSQDTFKTDLTSINLSYNKLTVLPGNIFNSLNFASLNLNNNKLKMLSSKWFAGDMYSGKRLTVTAENNSITHFNITSNQNLTVSLLNNKLNCNCHLQTQFLQYKSKPSSVDCFSPQILQGKKWEDLTLGQFACEPKLLDTVTKTSTDGTTKLIGCKVYGNPTPKIRWVNYNSSLPDNATHILQTTLTESKDVYWYSLTFSSNTTENFGGQYFCELSNAAGIIKMNFTVVSPLTSPIHVGTALWITALVLILIGVHVVLVMFFIKRINATGTSTVSDVPYANVMNENETQAIV